MTADQQLPVYRIYLLTAWQEPVQVDDEDQGWRFHLTDPKTGKRYGFTNAVDLLTALQAAVGHELPAERE
jgi:hypothetical protein